MRINKGNYAYGTHLPALLMCLLKTNGPVIEVGTGLYSTQVLKLFDLDRIICHVESNPHWIKDDAFYVKTVADALRYMQGRPFDVALIDSEVWGQRRYDILELIPVTKYFVVHDTDEDPSVYNYPLELFRYVRHFKELKPWTSILSNSDDPNLWGR